MRGVSFTHSGHQVAQKLTTMTLPRASGKRSCSAGRCGISRKAANAPIASAPSAAIMALMRGVILGGAAAAVMLCTAPAMGQLERITSRDASAALKAALEKGALAAVATL